MGGPGDVSAAPITDPSQVPGQGAVIPPAPPTGAPTPNPPTYPDTGTALIAPFQTGLGYTDYGAQLAADAATGSAPPISSDPNTPQMQEAMRQVELLTKGPIGSAPATRQAMKSWDELVRPTVLGGQAITGNLGGGATEEALSLGKTSALTPLLQHEEDVRAGLVPQLGNISLGISGQELDAEKANQLAALAKGQQRLSAADTIERAGGQAGALGAGQEQVYMDAFRQAQEAAGMPRDVAAAQAQADYQDFLRRMGLSEQMFLGPTGNEIAGALTPGSITTSSSSGGGIFGKG